MEKYLVSATVTIRVQDLKVDLQSTPNEPLEFNDAVVQKLEQRLCILDLKGARTGDDGFVDSIECDEVDSWEHL